MDFVRKILFPGYGDDILRNVLIAAMGAIMMFGVGILLVFGWAGVCMMTSGVFIAYACYGLHTHSTLKKSSDISPDDKRPSSLVVGKETSSEDNV